MGYFEQFNSSETSLSEMYKNNLSAYFTDRSLPMQRCSNDTRITRKISELELTIENRSGKLMSSDALDAGRIRTSIEADYTGQRTTAEYPNGVKITITELTTAFEVSSLTQVEAKTPNHKNARNEVVNKEGRVIAKVNHDGSVSVNVKEDYYTQYPDGTIRREMGVKTPDRTFRIIDQFNPTRQN